MAQNTSPIFILTPKNYYSTLLTTANTALDGTGTVNTIATAGANGSKIQKLRILHMGTNVATVVRVFINNGSTNAIASNNALIAEFAVEANTLNQAAASIYSEILLELPLAAGNKLNVTIGTSVAAGVMVSAEGGDY